MKKVLVVFLAVAMLFAFSAAALAAPSDLVGEPTDVQDAFNKFIAYGFIEGYEDGTVKPYNEITRAEFAKIICMLTGNGSMGDSLKGTASQFKDVAAGEWYTGWVNGAAAVGYFVGYTDGTFKPSNKVTDGEVITVLLRIAGYNDNLAGSWPYNYVVKGNSLGIVEEAINFSAAANSSRANVVLMANALLDKDVPMVAFSKDTESFVNVKDGNDKVQTVANYYKAIGNTSEYVIGDWFKNAKGQMALTATLNSASKSLVFADDYQIADGLSLYDLEGLTAKITLNKDDKIVFVDPLDTVIISSNFSITSGTVYERDTITINGTRYNNGLNGKISTDVKASSATLGTQTYRFVINEDGQLVSATLVNKHGDVFELDANGVPTPTVKSGFAYGVVRTISSVGVINTNSELGNRGGTFATSSDLNNKDIVVFVDGKLASISDIKENYFVVQYKGVNGVDYIYRATSPATAAVTSITGSDSGAVARIVVNGVTYYSPFSVKMAGVDASYKSLIVTDFNDYGLKGEEAMAIRLNNGAIIALSYGEVSSSSSTVYGIITGTTYQTESSRDQFGNLVSTPVGYRDITVVTSTGETKTYSLKDNGKKISYLFDNAGDLIDLPAGKAVVLTLNSDGLVQNMGSMVSASGVNSAALNSNKTTLTVSGTPYTINSSTVYMVVSMDSNNKLDKVEIKSLSAVSSGDAIKGAVIEIRVSSGYVTHVIVTGSTSSDYKYGVVRGLYDGDGNQIRFYDGGIYDKNNILTAVASDVVRYTVSNDEVTIDRVLVTLADVKDHNSTSTFKLPVVGVDSITSSVIRLANASNGFSSYIIDEDTLVVVYSGDAYSNNTYSYADISTDDMVMVIPAVDDNGNDKNTAAVIVVIR